MRCTRCHGRLYAWDTGEFYCFACGAWCALDGSLVAREPTKQDFNDINGHSGENIRLSGVEYPTRSGQVKVL